MNLLTDRISIFNYFDRRLIVKLFFKQKWQHFLVLLHLFILCDGKLNAFGFVQMLSRMKQFKGVTKL